MRKYDLRPLSETAASYLQDEYGAKTLKTRGIVRCCLRKLHAWMEENNLTLSDLKPSHYPLFHRHLAQKGFSAKYLGGIRVTMQSYFRWLQERSLWTGNLKDFFPRMGKHTSINIMLPPDATQFLQVIAAQVKPSTHNAYRWSLRLFHNFLNIHEIFPHTVRRPEIENFLCHLARAEAALCCRSRAKILREVRTYLQWLHEHGALDSDPYSLFRAKDFPKSPHYLPRPLPLEIDLELQNRLSQSSNILHWGLLLMRGTGVRLGELASLTFDCVRVDLR